MPPQNPLSLHFHIDPRLAIGRDEFHFHVRLEDIDGQGRRVPMQRVPVAEYPLVDPAVITWCQPPDGTPVQKVRATDSGKGSICASGKITVGSSDPQEVKARIYPPTGAIPDVPPSDAHTVGGKMNPIISLPTGCSAIAVNFAFHAKYGNEIPNAAHGASPKLNRLVIWAKFNGVWQRASPIQFFKGQTATTTECGDAPSGSGYGTFASLEFCGHRKYVVTSKGTFPPAETAITFVRSGPEYGPMLSWKSCSKANPDSEWKFWVTGVDGKPVGTIALTSMNGKSLVVPLVWKCTNWEPNAVCEFLLNTPKDSPHAGSALVCEPA